MRRGTFQLTPLGEAALGRHAEVMTLLLDKGADISFKAGVSRAIGNTLFEVMYIMIL